MKFKRYILVNDEETEYFDGSHNELHKLTETDEDISFVMFKNKRSARDFMNEHNLNLKIKKLKIKIK